MKHKRRGAKPSSTPSVGVVGETSVKQPSASATRELLERIACGSRGERLRASLARRHSDRSTEEVEEAFREAIARGYASCRGRSAAQVYTWLSRTMDNLLADRRRLVSRELVVDAHSPVFLQAVDVREQPEREVGRSEDRRELRELGRALTRSLSPRQRYVFALYGAGAERKQMAARLGASEKAIKKDLERISALTRQYVVARAGRGCQDGESLISRYAFRLASTAEVKEAQLHLARCPRCGDLYVRLELWREEVLARVAALLPLPAVEHVESGLVERAVEKAADAMAAWKQQATEGAAHLKQNATATYYRAVDPSPLAGARPGTAVAAIASCLAIGGGAATYCVERGVNPVAELGMLIDRGAAEERTKPRARKAQSAPTPDPPQVPASTPTPTPQPPPSPAPAPTREPPPPPPPPAPEDQYEPTHPGTQASTPLREPAPAPADGPGEFTGP